MSKLNLGLHILALYVVFIAHQIHGGELHPTNQKVNMLLLQIYVTSSSNEGVI